MKAGKIIRWVASVFLLLMALVYISDGSLRGFFAGLIFLIGAIVVNPLFAILIEKITGFELKGWLSGIAAGIVFFVGAFAAPQSETTTTTDVVDVVEETIDINENQGENIVEEYTQKEDAITSLVSPMSSSEYKGKKYGAVQRVFADAGFEVVLNPIEQNASETTNKNADVIDVAINNQKEFEKNDIFPVGSEVIVNYSKIIKDEMQEVSKEVSAQSPINKTETSESTIVDNSADTVSVPSVADTQGELVWIPTNGGKKYHSKSSCSGMNGPMQVSIDQAIANGFTPCKRCH